MTGLMFCRRLFPYTTLFRSARAAAPVGAGPGRTGELAVPMVSIGRSPATALQGLSAPHRARKSTRLNSSHVEISYAVFCLKKKTQIRAQLTAHTPYRIHPHA